MKQFSDKEGKHMFTFFEICFKKINSIFNRIEDGRNENR